MEIEDCIYIPYLGSAVCFPHVQSFGFGFYLELKCRHVDPSFCVMSATSHYVQSDFSMVSC